MGFILQEILCYFSIQLHNISIIKKTFYDTQCDLIYPWVVCYHFLNLGLINYESGLLNEAKSKLENMVNKPFMYVCIYNLLIISLVEFIVVQLW